MNEKPSTTATAPSGAPRIIALIAAAGFLLTGLGAMAAPEAFFDAAATFDPYNQHFIQDIGAFNLGIGAILLLATRTGADALAASLAGATVGSVAHVLSHVIGHDLGGQPAIDIPAFAVLAVLTGWAAVTRYRDLNR